MTGNAMPARPPVTGAALFDGTPRPSRTAAYDAFSRRHSSSSARHFDSCCCAVNFVS